MGIQSLHNHTAISDGKLTHLEVLDTASQAGISVIAFTDHDIVPDEKILKTLKENKNHTTKWLIGIEMSSGFPKEMEGQPKGDLHIIGLFVNPRNSELKRYCEHSIKNRLEKTRKTVQNLQKIGFDITLEECLKVSGQGSIGRPHIVTVLTSTAKNLELIEKYRKELREKAKNDSKLNQKYQAMMEQGPKQYPYTLFLSGKAFVSEVYIEEGTTIDLDKVVFLIRNAGGIASIAHYATIKSEMGLEKLEELLKDNRIDSVETVYGFWKYGSSEESEIEKERDEVRKLLKKYKKVKTGGADAHYPAQFQEYAQASWYSKESEDMVENIMKDFKLDTTWSSV